MAILQSCFLIYPNGLATLCDHSAILNESHPVVFLCNCHSTTSKKKKVGIFFNFYSKDVRYNFRMACNWFRDLWISANHWLSIRHCHVQAKFALEFFYFRFYFIFIYVRSNKIRHNMHMLQMIQMFVCVMFIFLRAKFRLSACFFHKCTYIHNNCLFKKALALFMREHFSVPYILV